MILAETLRASMAVNTKYIKLIINCRGSFGIDITLSVYRFKNMVPSDSCGYAWRLPAVMAEITPP